MNDFDGRMECYILRLIKIGTAGSRMMEKLDAPRLALVSMASGADMNLEFLQTLILRQVSKKEVGCEEKQWRRWKVESVGQFGNGARCCAALGWELGRNDDGRESKRAF